MSPEELRSRKPEQEFIFSASRSGGPGGQNVNKVNSRIELRINIADSLIFSDSEKQILLSKLRNKISRDGDLIIVAQSERSQLQNKRIAEEKFFKLVAKLLTPVEDRKATRPTSASVEKRLETKKSTGTKKKLRKFTDDLNE